MLLNEQINRAIMSHQQWTQHLLAYLKQGAGEPGSLAQIEDHLSCALGEWLSSDMADRHLPGEIISSLAVQHVIFHELAADAFRLHQADPHAPETILAITGFEVTSTVLIAMLEAAKASRLTDIVMPGFALQTDTSPALDSPIPPRA